MTSSISEDIALDDALTFRIDNRALLDDLEGSMSALESCENLDDALANLSAMIESMSALTKRAKKLMRAIDKCKHG